MPSYYFDIDRDGDRVRDEIGTDLPDDAAALDEAVHAIEALARSRMRDASYREIAALVRDESGRPILAARVTIAVEWLEPGP